MSKATFVEQGAPPAIPAIGRVTIYALNGFMYSIDDLGAITPLTGGSNEPAGYINGLDVDYLTAQTLQIGAGSARSGDDTHDIDLGAPVIVDVGVSGAANGLDSGIENPNTWYAVHLIDDSNNVNPAAGLLSLSPTAPTLPAGYDKFRHINWVRNHTNDFLKWYSLGVGRTRTIYWDVARNSAPQRVTSGGAATSWSTVNMSTVVPPAVVNVLVNVQQTSGFIGTRVRANGSVDTSGTTFCRQGNSMQFLVQSVDQNIQYENTGGSGNTTLDIVGWTLAI